MKIWKKAIGFLLIVAVMAAANHFIITPRYNRRMIYATYLDKARAAEKIGGEKMIFLGGSSPNLSLSAREFERLSGVPSVNMAVVAEVPMEIYLKMAEMYANPGDTVFFVMESFAFVETVGEYGEGYLDMTAVDGRLCTARSLPDRVRYLSRQFLRGFSRLNDLVSYYVYQKADPGSVGSIYVSGTCDEYGDFVAHKGLAPSYRREMTVGTTNVSLDTKMVARMRETFTRLNENGVTVYVTYAPTDGDRYENRDAFYARLQEMAEEAYGEWILGTPSDFFYDEDRFYDSAHHLRYECREEYTGDLYRVWLERTSE